LLVEVGDNDMRAELRQKTYGRAANAARSAGDHGYSPRKLALRRSLLELVPLQGPILDGERLCLGK
jgi:hypothetical protein